MHAARKHISSLLFLVLAHASVIAAPWDFSAPVDVTKARHGQSVFHHLGSGGRNALAVSRKGSVAVVWEDNRDGVVRCYAAWRDSGNSAFEERQISGDESCYEPAVTAMSDGWFAVAWEEGGSVWARILAGRDVGSPVSPGGQNASQVAITSISGHELVAAWAQPERNHKRIWVATFVTDGEGGLQVVHSQAVETGALKGDQAYPDILALDDERLLLAWEDRRSGHTVILASEGETSLRFTQPQQINESFWRGRALGYGRGTGAMRVSLASSDGRRAIAVWADKRDFRSGYDVYAAIRDDGSSEFSVNEKVQDGFADMVAQWHPSVAAGSFGAHTVTAAAWDDDRDGTPDIWLSWRIANQWSDDFEVPGASGAGVQVEPAIAVDGKGYLHLAWLEKDRPDGPSRIRYVSGRPDLAHFSGAPQ